MSLDKSDMVSEPTVIGIGGVTMSQQLVGISSDLIVSKLFLEHCNDLVYFCFRRISIIILIRKEVLF